ncbi:MAG: hypothetical protein ACR2PZ_02690 [Pseudomonadales bacterium]
MVACLLLALNFLGLAQQSPIAIAIHGGAGTITPEDLTATEERDSQGEIAQPFNTEGMYRAKIDKDGQETVQIYR